MVEVARFREWAKGYPLEARSGEWECDYHDWHDLHDAVLEFFRSRRFESWSAAEVDAVLYAIARDNEIQYLARQVRQHHLALLIPLATAAAATGDRDSKWQLAEELGHLGQTGGEAERLLLLLARDGEEYVRRKSLQALASIGALATEELALFEWHRPDEDQQWARMMALDCLRRIASHHFDALLADAERDERPYLSAYARRLRMGEVDA
ncbi:MAG: hypothetical protein ABJE95_01585 [Byssovorax sp.]